MPLRFGQNQWGGTASGHIGQWAHRPFAFRHEPPSPKPAVTSRVRLSGSVCADKHTKARTHRHTVASLHAELRTDSQPLLFFTSRRMRKYPDQGQQLGQASAGNLVLSVCERVKAIHQAVLHSRSQSESRSPGPATVFWVKSRMHRHIAPGSRLQGQTDVNTA
ncbi:Vacuolar transporter chaperone 2 [Dissostichus eleginoides]|uniref:Vacuolar transporter chaperone 2 n=1 Tax=Dissostichus eleginoides TaxID=100907 RepID=A0AAD9CMF0_DISEL|nr:Vacuolar transporter chaperone 2 [Dissostichus eleginoides]